MPQTVDQGGQTQSVFVPIGNWQPDVPTPMNQGMPFSLNLVPQPTGFYGPERALQTVGQTQDTTPFGAALKVNGSLHSRPPASGDRPQYYVGTYAVADGASRILQREEDGPWQDVSKVGGYTTTASNVWRFANFGNKVLASQRQNRLQISDGDNGDIFRDVSADISGADVATVRGFGVLVNTVDRDFGDGVQPFRVHWSAIGDAENWPDPLSDEAINVQSGFRDLFGGGRLRRCIPGIGGADAIIVSDRKMWRMRFVGPPQTFEFDEIETDQGTTVAGSIAAWNEQFFFYGHNKFYFFDGSNSQPIGVGEMDRFFENDIDLAPAFARQNAIEAAIDSVNKTYVVSYRSRDATTDANDKILRFNWISGQWSVSAIAADTVGHVDTFVARTDSPRLLLLGQDFQIKTATGSTLESIIEGREFAHDNGSYYEVKGVLPYIDTDAVKVDIRVRDSQAKDPLTDGEFDLQEDGFARFWPKRPTGRFYRCRLRVPAGSSWTAVTGMLYEYMEHSSGTRRT